MFSGDGGQTLLIGDVLDAMDGVNDGSANCPVVNIVNNVPDPVALKQVFDDPNCFSFREMFPGGFTPQFGGNVLDASAGGGHQGPHGLAASFGTRAPATGRNLVGFLHLQHGQRGARARRLPRTFDPGLYNQEELNVNRGSLL